MRGKDSRAFMIRLGLGLSLCAETGVLVHELNLFGGVQ
jgi:hypothetical protein